MLQTLKSQLISQIKDVVQSMDNVDASVDVIIEIPNDRLHGDLSCNVAMRLTKILKSNPMAIAEDLCARLQTKIDSSDCKDYFEKIEIKKPGFINFFLSKEAFSAILDDILTKKDQYGKTTMGQDEKVLVEFVSANPTGPLTVAHARQAAVGDVLVNILQATGHTAAREYYVNDGGNQIRTLGESIKVRGQQILGKDVEFLEDGYHGQYIQEMAQMLIDQKSIASLSDWEAVSDEDFQEFGKTYLLDEIKKDLEGFGVVFDHFSYESQVATQEKIKELIEDFKSKGYVYDNEGALWFKTTDFGDDKDRVVQKSDGNYTYLTPDIVYHGYKFDRGFNRLIDILGPDHHGYISRIKASAQALGNEADALNVLIVQLASIYRDGHQLSMSTRRGEFISLREVMQDVGVDAARFFFLMRQVSQHLDFDLDLAKKQSNENPVYYVQYAHARTYSLMRKANDQGIIEYEQSDFSLLEENEEKDLIFKLAQLPDVLNACARVTDPFGLVRYMQELASVFHRFYDRCRVIDENKELSKQRLGLIKTAQVVLFNGLTLLGVSTPEQM